MPLGSQPDEIGRSGNADELQLDTDTLIDLYVFVDSCTIDDLKTDIMDELQDALAESLMVLDRDHIIKIFNDVKYAGSDEAPLKKFCAAFL